MCSCASTVMLVLIKMHTTLVLTGLSLLGTLNADAFGLSIVHTKVPLDNSMHEVILSDGSKASGYLVETRHQMTKFDPKTKRAVEQWSGTRCSIIAYTTRGLAELSQARKRCAQELRVYPWEERGHACMGARA